MESDNLLLNNNISYKIISQYQKVENDKERIKSKFNFNISRTSTNSSIFKQSSLPTQKNSIIIQNKKKKIKNKILQQNDKSFNITHHYRPKSNINIKINTNNNSIHHKRHNKHNNKSKESVLSIKNKMVYENEINNNKNNKNHIPHHKNNNSIIDNKDNNTTNKTQIKSSKILNNINNITYSNYNTFINENSLTIIDNNKNLFQDSILKTQSIFDGINNYNSKHNINNHINLNNCIDINNKIDNFFNVKIEDENGEGTALENEISESSNKSSFSGSSKTSELHGDILNIKNNSNSANEGNIQIANNDNYVIKNFNGINKPIFESNKNKNEEEEIMEQYLRPFNNENSERKKTEVNTMGLLDDDEYNQENRKKMLNNISKYYFIEDIIEKNNKFISLSFDKFKNLNNKSKFKIFSFIYDNYKNYLNSSIYIRNIIHDMLEDKFSSCVKDFENKYKNILLIDNYKFNIHSFVKPKLKKKKFHTFCLYIKAKILPNNEYLRKFGDVSFKISYKYKIRSLKNEYNTKTNRTNISSQSFVSKDHIQEEYMQIFQFDLRKNKNFPMWICSERDEIFNNSLRNNNGGINNLLTRCLVEDELYQKHLIYSSPIINVNEGDYIVFRIDLIENNNIIENISFNEVIVQSVNKNYFHKISFKQEQKFDKMRDCENELAINVWHDDYAISNYDRNNNINYEEFFQKLKKIFRESFEIMEIKFDISKFVFIRMTMKAKKIGVLKSNIFSNKDIEIVDKNTSLTKECTTINFVNTFSMYKNLTIKQGTIVDFYLME